MNHLPSPTMLGKVSAEANTDANPSYGAITITGLPAFDSNYLWVMHNTFNAWVVDPGDASVVLHYLEKNQLNLSGILVTHHHADHTGGVFALKQAFPQATIIGPMSENIAHLTVNAIDLQTYQLMGLGTAASPIVARCLLVPGHTAGHVAYFLSNAESFPRLFCGDTLFAAGCGRLFEGTPEQMWASLQRLIGLPPETMVYCAHEYTASNLQFAAAVEPSNTEITERITHVAMLRAKDLATVPFVLGNEIHTNVFLRSADPHVAASASTHCGVELVEATDVFAALRAWKNIFRAAY